ncbi:MAG: hypothetical protein IKQ76_08270 [Bacteroidales bacterium]|nr:hypothetical protein [Bacteroidales bacterium]
MKKFICLFLLPFLFGSGVFAQEATAPKTGWKVSPFPAVGYDSNNGLQYGVFGDVYNYGAGDTYPDPLQKFTFEVSHFTKGRTRLRLSFDSKYLIPKMRLTLSAIYCHDPLYQFYGFNGAAEPYIPERNDKNAGTLYNSMQRSYFQGFANFQGTIAGHLNWAAGATFWHYRTGTFDGDKFKADAGNTLYNEYVSHGVIGKEEKDGGNVLELRAGLAYNSRDIEAAPNRGINADLFLNGAPDLSGTGHGYLRLCANFSHFIRIPVGFIAAGDPVFAYHVGLQHTWGDAPFYIQQNVPQLVPRRIMYEGLGGNSTIRGLYDNRIIADGFVWANAELRVKLVRFHIGKGDFYLATNPFVDAGVVTKPYRLERMALPYNTPAEELRKAAQQLTVSAGAGLKLAWNENFILSLEVARNLNQTGMGGKFWMNIITNYCF